MHKCKFKIITPLVLQTTHQPNKPNKVIEGDKKVEALLLIPLVFLQMQRIFVQISLMYRYYVDAQNIFSFII